jgi:beta-mannosidase
VVVKQRSVQLQPGRSVVKLVQTVDNPKLWWTWDHGAPHLYTAEIVVGGDDPYDAVVETFGIKQIEKDAKGQWYLNRRKLFLRGMRYLCKMLDMTINSIRIGSHVEHPRFYEMCDEMGFLVWQVFPLHYCYSDSDELIEKAAPMMAEMVAMFYNHASLGMWSVYGRSHSLGAHG